MSGAGTTRGWLTGVLAATTLVLAACGGADSAGESPAATETPIHSVSEDPDLLSETFDVGDGRELYVRCEGEGSPTILLEAGDESGISMWSPVWSALAAETRTCGYDRAGVGQSDPATGCRGLDDLLDDTEALLQAARIEPPYVLVGTSGGGYLMAGLAARHPDDVAGLVLLETAKAITIMTPELRQEISCDAPANLERRDYRAVEHAVWDHRRELGDFPMRIMTNDFGKYAPPGDEQTNVVDQRGWLELSPNSRQVVVTSGHDVVWNETDLTRKLILDVLDEARYR